MSEDQPLAELSVDCVEQLVPQAGAIGLASAAGLAKQALAAVTRLDAAAEAWRQRAATGALSREVEQTLNGALKGLSRILVPLGGTVADRYAHDPYGLSAQSTVLPGLYELPRLNALPASSDERHLLATELVRQRNRFADGMREVRDLAERTLAAVGG